MIACVRYLWALTPCGCQPWIWASAPSPPGSPAPHSSVFSPPPTNQSISMCSNCWPPFYLRINFWTDGNNFLPLKHPVSSYNYRWYDTGTQRTLVQRRLTGTLFYHLTFLRPTVPYMVDLLFVQYMFFLSFLTLLPAHCSGKTLEQVRLILLLYPVPSIVQFTTLEHVILPFFIMRSTYRYDTVRTYRELHFEPLKWYFYFLFTAPWA